jgi:hypothetical protein
MMWTSFVNKQRGGGKNQQSMAEAVAKHFKEFLEKKYIRAKIELLNVASP